MNLILSKYLRRYLIALLVFTVIAAGTPAYAAPNGTQTGRIYATDISASVDGMPITGYNIGGKTVIVMEELAEYGYSVYWSQRTRELYVRTVDLPEAPPAYSAPAPVKTGTPAGAYYATDIRLYINDELVRSYNIGGRTVAAIEDIGKLPGFEAVWNARARTIALNCKRYTAVPDTSHNVEPFTEVYCGSNYAILGKDGVYYRLGGGSDSLYPSIPMRLDGTLEESGVYVDAPPDTSECYLDSGGSFIQRDGGTVIASGVKAVFPWDISHGWRFGRFLLLKNDGSLWFTRINDPSGASRWGDSRDLSTPVKIMDGVTYAATGGSYAYFAIKSDSTLWWFGDNFHGEAGNGARDEWDSDKHVENPSGFKPVKIMDNIANVVCGSEHVLALTNDGVLYGWGQNALGPLGQKETECLTPVTLMEDVATVASSSYCTYVIKTDGTLWYSGTVVGEYDVSGTVNQFTQINELYRLEYIYYYE